MIEMPETAILIRHFQGKTSRDTDETIHKWRKDDAENEAIYHHLRLIWEESGNPKAIPKMDLDRGWDRLSNHLGFNEVTEVGNQPLSLQTKPKQSRIPAWTYAFAALVIAALLGLWLNNPFAANEAIFVTGMGEQREVVLEDGSKVWMDSASKLTHVRGFSGKARLVQLEGHAFFEVTKGDKSFIVQTPSATVRVLGTEFDVWAGNGKTKVVVREGLVSLRGRTGTQTVEVGPNQYSECTSQGNPKAPVIIDAANLLVWLQGSRMYHQEPLADVALDLSRLFGKSIKVSDPQLAEQTLTATFRNESLREILEEICLTLNMEYIEEEGGYILNPVR